MDRSALIRTLLIFGVVLLVWKVIWPAVSGDNKDKPQQVTEETYVNAPDFSPDPVIEKPVENAPPMAAEEICHIRGNRFEADLSTRGAAITGLQLAGEQYADVKMVTSASTGSAIERWRPLRTHFRGSEANDQLRYDRFNWKLDPSTFGNKTCQFSYEDQDVRIEKTITAGEGPFEVAVETTVKNLAVSPRNHQLTLETFDFYKIEVFKGHSGRVSPYISDLDCGHGDTVLRKGKDDFKEGWVTAPNTDRFAAISNYYFANVIVPQNGPGTCEVLAEDWVSEGQKRDDDQAGAVYHARLAYDPRTLKQGETATYEQIGFFGPKERDLLKQAGGPGKGLGDLINLGFFSPVAKVLVGSLVWLKDHITHNWGLAIILLTLLLKVILFPLQWKSIKAMVGMRKLKPDIDEINKKFADDMQSKNLAMMELYKKRGVNPLGGCLPQLVQMPVWFAMYTTLQTAVEMYHTRFLWFADLSAPDPLFGPIHIPMFGTFPALGPLPFVLGAFMILQQRIVPQQGMDPVQQKIMTYVMPAVFMIMMLFLPAALGVYMLTNSVLGIAQQLIVEKVAPRDAPPGEQKKNNIEVTVLRKDKARV